VTDALDRALDGLVPCCDGAAGDWEAVLAGARRPRKRRRRLLLAAVALAVATALAVTPAFGVRSLILGLIGKTNVSFSSSPSAPAIVKVRFYELDEGAPPGMAQLPIAGETRAVTIRGAAGQKHVLWIAPTKNGGFCAVGVAGHGCLSKAARAKAAPLTAEGDDRIADRRATMVAVDGEVLSPAVASLTLDFADGTSLPLPFVYVGEPIGAGFYFYAVPAQRRQTGTRPVAVVARDAAGKTLATRSLHLPSGRETAPLPPGQLRTQATRALPAASTVNPAGTVERATASGVSVVAGSNGAVRFTAFALPPSLQKLTGRAVTYSCFRLTHKFGLQVVLGDGASGALGSSVGLRLARLHGAPDGCEIDGTAGHRWPDRNGSHSLVELPFTATGRAYFADRAAARDLSLFVRSSRMQKIRREPGPQLARDLQAAYGKQLAHSRIHYELTANGVTFTETSTTGKRFEVVVAHGKVVQSNVRPYALVF
jgi:hypothetical protein